MTKKNTTKIEEQNPAPKEVGAKKSKKSLPTTNTKTPMPKVKPSKDSKPEEKAKEPTPMEIKNELVTSAVDDCRIIIATYNGLKKDRPLATPETYILFNAFFRLTEIYDQYGTDKKDAINCINEAIIIGSNVLDLNIVSEAILYRSKLKIKLSNVI